MTQYHSPVASSTHTDGGDITLRDVITHMQGMELRINARMERLERRLESMEQRMTSVEANIRDLTDRMDALDEDLAATMKDIRIIRVHVGIPVSEEA